MKKKVLSIMLILAMMLSMGSAYLAYPEALAASKKNESLGKSEKIMSNVFGNSGGFLLADAETAVAVYVDTENEEISEGACLLYTSFLERKFISV